jgi:putative hydrolase of the HAD superfamily
MLKAIFFDAVGTLIHLTKSVGQHYHLVAQRQGLTLDPNLLETAFVQVWKEMPLRPAIGEPRADDDKDWWRDLVEKMLARIPGTIDPLDRDNFFEAAYGHFAEAGVWALYPEVFDSLEKLAPRFELAIVSNFDGRLRVILEQLAISRFFRHVFVSSEIGADKPDPAIYRRALEISGLSPNQVLHVGDDPERDWAAARAADLAVFELIRPGNSLSDLLERLRAPVNHRKN